jgi:RNA polymerase sigma-70 factor (ECF subfamily)
MDDPNQHGERFLVARMLRGDEAAFTTFFDAHFAPLFRFALPRVGGDVDVAEEVVQTALCRAVRKLDTFRGEASLLTWLCTICRNEIATYFQKRKRTPPMLDVTEDLPEIRAALESLSARGTAEAEQRNETARIVQVVLDRLPSHYADALEWKYLDGLSVTEIAERMHLGAKAAESVLTRARNAFRDGFATLHGAHS